MIKYNKFFKNPKFVAHQHFKECHEVLKKNCTYKLFSSSIVLFFKVQKRHTSNFSHKSISKFPSNYYLSTSIDRKEYQ